MITNDVVHINVGALMSVPVRMKTQSKKRSLSLLAALWFWVSTPVPPAGLPRQKSS